MKLNWFVCIAFLILLAGCQKTTPLEIKGSADLPDGAIVSVNNDSDSTLTSSFVIKGKFEIKKFGLDSGYYTLTIKTGDKRHDFDVYLAPGEYNIVFPDSAGKYLTVKTSSSTQNKLTSYYNLEDSVLYRFRQATKKAAAEIADPKNAKISEADFQKLVNNQNSAKAREIGAITAAMNLYIDKHPKTDIILHIIGNMDYKADPTTYQIVFDHLCTEVKNSPAGKELKTKLTEGNIPKRAPTRA